MAIKILGDIVSVVSEHISNPSKSGYHIFVGLEHYDSGEPVITRHGSTEQLESSVKHFIEGDILVARRNVYLKRAGVVNFEGVTSGDSIVLRVKEEKYKDIIPFILNTDDFWDYAEQNSDGTMSKRLAPDVLLEYECNIPENHQSIADKLWAAYKLKVSYKQMITATDEMVKSQFIEMFGNLDTNIKSYPVTTVEKISLNLFAGGDKPEDTSTERTDKYIYPVWANGEGERGLMGYSKTYRVDKEALTISARGTIGYCAIREPYFTPIVRLITLIPNEKVDIVYLKYFFDQTGFESTGAVQGQLTIPTIKVKKVLVPPIEEQMKFAEVVKQADKSKFELRKSIEAIDAVIKSLING